MSEHSVFTNLLKARNSKGITQTQLSELLGLPQGYISQLEKGRHDVKISTLTAWARLLDLEVMLVPRSQVAVVSYLLSAGSADRHEVPPAYGPLPDEVQ